MVPPIKNGDRHWMAWTLSIAISIIAALTCALSYGSFTLIREMRAEFLQEIKEVKKTNEDQNTCIAKVETEVKNLKERLPRLGSGDFGKE